MAATTDEATGEATDEQQQQQHHHHHHRGRLVAVWDRDRFGLSHQDYNRRVQCYKRLDRLWADRRVRESHPDYAAGGRWDQSNTVLVDDSAEKARSQPYNLVCIPEFAGQQHERPEILPQVHDYLNHLAYQADVSSFIRRYPFRPLPDGWMPPSS